MRKLIPHSISILLVWAMLLGLSGCTLAKESAQPVQATVIEIEKYGHAVLDITTADFFAAGYALGDVVCVRFGDHIWQIPFFDGYYVNPGEMLLRGLSPEKNIAVCINYENLSEITGITLGDWVEITLAEKAGMLAYQELCALQYSNDRADYADDATFANFRAVTAGSIGSGKLYRSASPINNAYGRAGYANAFIEAAGVAAVLNLADSEEDMAQHFASADFASAYYLSLYQSGKVMALDLSSNFFSDSFAASVVTGLRFLAQGQPPYHIHCTEGKDRAGFTAMLLEALMGASLQEIIDDYMLSFYNYYGIDPTGTPARYEAVLHNNIIPLLYHVTGGDSMEALAQMDLEAAVTDFLLNHGMPAEDILLLKDKLR